MGDRAIRATISHQLATALYMQGRWDEAEHFARESEDLGASNDTEVQMGWRRIRARLLARRGEFGDAGRVADEAVEISRRGDSPNDQADALMALGEVLSLAGERDRAAEAVREALELYEVKENVISARSARQALEALEAGLEWPPPNASP